MSLSPEQLIYELHTLLLDIETKDVRLHRYRALGGKVRPYLTVVLALAGSYIAAYCLSPEPPNQQSISALLFRAMTQSGDLPFGGMPKEIRVDGSARPFLPHLQGACDDLGISLRPLTSEHPSTGEGERFLETLQARIREELPAYMGPTTGNETVHPTLDELEHILKDCLDEYHRSANSGVRQPPLAMHDFSGAADLRRLVRLFGEGARRAVTSKGIVYHARRYWHEELASLPRGTEVIIYTTTSPTIPKSVEVFHQGTWLCTASVYRG